MANQLNEAAPHNLPPFIAAPGDTDILFVVIVCLIIAIVLIIGNFYLKLHALPESMAHRANSTQLQLVGVLSLLALFTHNNIFWIGALLIAALRIPDFSTPLTSIARSLDDLSDRLDREGAFGAEVAQQAPVPTSAPTPPPAPEASVLSEATVLSEAPGDSEPPAASPEAADPSKPDEPNR